MIPEARGQAQRLREEANGYRDATISRAEGEADRFTKLVTEYRKAPEVTRQRLYLETMQEVLSNTSKVLLTGDKGQNSMLYLPLDKMLEGRNAASPKTTSTTTGSSNSSSDNSVRLSSDALSRDLRARGSR